MKRFSKRIQCGGCGKTHYATPSDATPGRLYATCPRCGMEVLIERGKQTVLRLAMEEYTFEQR